MKKGQELMEPTVSLMTTKATRLAVFALSLTAVSSMPAIAFSTDARNENASANVRGGGASHPAAKPSTPARSNNMSRPAQSSARPSAAPSSSGRASASSSSGRATTASHSAASRPASAHAATGTRPNSARPNTAKASNARPQAGHANAAHDDHRNVARGADHGRSDRGGHADARNDHRDARGDHRDARGDHRDARNDHRDARGGDRHDFRNASYSHATNLRGGREIPGDRFHASFGSEHPFHIGHPVMIGGQASFSFGGFWFGIVDPWPAAWLYTDPVYVDLVDGGYVLVNELHPGVEVAVSAGDPAPATCPAADAPAAAPAPVATAPVATVRPVVVAYTPFYTYFTWHYWGPYWHHYWR